MTNQPPFIHDIFPTEEHHNIRNIFPTPVYITKRNTDLIPREEKEIEKIIKSGMLPNKGNNSTFNTYVFDSKLKKLKQFCERHIKIYVEQIINPKEKLDFYITQSWINVTKPGEFHHEHFHNNSLISGVFYISTEEDDRIEFGDHVGIVKNRLKIIPKEFNLWNSTSWFFPVKNNELILFPSYLSHKVEPNEKATTDRISLSFNTFVKGTLGERHLADELILK